jgi:hypothetical protein
LYRRRFDFETSQQEIARGLVLLKVTGEDEQVRKRRMELLHMLQEVWVKRRDRRNWCCRAGGVGGVRGGRGKRIWKGFRARDWGEWC